MENGTDMEIFDNGYIINIKVHIKCLAGKRFEDCYLSITK